MSRLLPTIVALFSQRLRAPGAQGKWLICSSQHLKYVRQGCVKGRASGRLTTGHGEAGLDLGNWETGKSGTFIMTEPGGEQALERAELTAIGPPRAAVSPVRQDLCEFWLPHFLRGFEQVTSLHVPQFPHL